MDWVWYVVLVGVQIIGLSIIVVGLPGIWVMAGGTALYAWYTGWTYVSLTTVLVLVGIGIVSEIVEFVAGGAAAKKAGGSMRSAWGALLGGFVGALVLSIPVPLIGTIIGACLGAFAGALVAEYTVQQHTEQSLRVGWAAAKGRLWGIPSKLVFAAMILAISLVAAFPGFSRTPAAVPGASPAPSTQPASLPSM